MSLPKSNKFPSNWWWVGHAFFGIFTGLVCYIVWKDDNANAAKKHLIHSIWIGVVFPVVAFLIFFALLGFALEHMDDEFVSL